MLNIVIPMAGAGSRFSKVGYKVPKPLISIHGTPMINVVINNLRPDCEHRFIFICQQAHLEAYNLVAKLKSYTPNCEIIGINGLTEGAACTVLAAKELICNNDKLMIANSDQFVNYNINTYLKDVDKKNLDGHIMTMKADNPKWSFVRLDDNNHVINVVEKEVVSNEATVGIYNFANGKDFVHAAKEMINSNDRVNGEFYVAPVYNQLIKRNCKVGIFNIGEVQSGMYGLGTPDDLNAFLDTDICQRALSEEIR